MNALVAWEGKQLDLIRRTVAKDCDAMEFDQFIHICKAVRLDPLRRQIYAFVFSKDDPKKRQMTIVTAIGGYRAIADRTGNYRPGKSEVIIDHALRDEHRNPLGISHAVVSVFKHAHGEWHEVIETAYWDEFAPIVKGGDGGFEWVPTGYFYEAGHEKAGKPKMKKQPIGEQREMLDPSKAQWRKMPRVLIEKCAEARVLRKAWPDDFAGLEVEEETDRRAALDLTATELADQSASQDRFARIGGKAAILIDWCDGEPLQRVAVGQFGDQALKFITANKEEPSTIAMWEHRNKLGLQEYWAHDKSGSLEVKRALEVFKSEATAA